MTAINKIVQSIQTSPGSWIPIGIILVVFLLFSGVMAKCVFWIIRLFAKRTPEDAWQTLVNSFKKPLTFFIFLLGVFLAFSLMPISKDDTKNMIPYIRVAFIISTAYGIYHMEGLLATLFSKINESGNLRGGELLNQFAIRMIRVVVFAFTVALVADQFHINAGGIIAGLGIAGLAVAMAAKESLSHVFAGIMLVMDRPFDIGERIKVGAHDGIVENINFRSTRIRLLTQELVTIPNSEVANSAIINFTRRAQRKCVFRLELSDKNNKKQLLAFLDVLREAIKKNDGVDADTVAVCLETLAVTGPVLQVSYLTDVEDWEIYQQARQRAVFIIMELMGKHEIKAVAPVQMVKLDSASVAK